jgi:Tfp pilus assembly protein FimT
VELIVVMMLVAVVMGLSIPRFREAILTDELKATTRRLVGAIRDLRNDAVRDQTTYDLHIDLESGLYWVDSPDMSEEARVLAREKAIPLPSGIRILDIWRHGKGKKMTGETAIRFTKKGYVQQSVIHLAPEEDDWEFTLVLMPFMGEVKVLENYIEFEDV